MKVRKIYLLIYACLLTVFMLCVQKEYVFAGDINSNEARVIGAASGTFEYNGELYVAAPGYVSELTEYLGKDGVDLDAAQAETAINKIYSNIETGVKEGYIVKVSGSDNNTGSDNITDSDNDTNSDNADPGKAENDNKDNQPKKTAKPESTEAPTPIPQIVTNDNGTKDVYTIDGNKLVSFDGVLKNTGYSINRTIIIIGVLAMLFIIMILACIIYAYKNNKSVAGKYVTRT